ncbi:hypothetical protein AX23_04060 [Brucella melitensis 548]|nr:hypothetical protein AX23_04060 [Brucella melitensis 548]
MNPNTSPVWHPFTQHRLEPRPDRIVRTEGAYLFVRMAARFWT